MASMAEERRLDIITPMQKEEEEEVLSSPSDALSAVLIAADDAPRVPDDGADVLGTPGALVAAPESVEVLPLQEPPVTQVVVVPARYTRQPAQVSLPPEMAAKLGRQDSSDSMEEEGIQADAPLDGQDAPLEKQEEEGHEEQLEPRSERSSSVVSDGSEEGGRDSGIEAEREADMVIPDVDLMTRIVTQVEFYFSDANVSKDKFLLKHIRRNKEGYVSLKLVSSFKKVKQLTKDWRVVAFSLTKTSDKMQMNDAGTKIRRVEPLPDLEDVITTCAVLAIGLPLEKPNIQTVSQLFSSCGDIAFIRVLRAGGAVPQDLKSLAAKHPALGDANCAWLEFETPEAAKAATDMSSSDDEGGMKVVPILPEAEPKKKQEKPQSHKGSQPNSRKNSFAGSSNGGSHYYQQYPKGPASRKNSFVKFRKDSTTSGSEGEAATPQHYQRFPRRKCLSLPQTQSPNLKELSAVVEARRNRPKSKSCTEFQLGGLSSAPPSSSSSSWVQRHLLAAAAASAASAASPVVGSRPPVLCRPARISQGSLPLPDGVVRFPKGPDGSKGFNAEARRRTSSTPAAATTTTATPTQTTCSPSASPSEGSPSS